MPLILVILKKLIITCACNKLGLRIFFFTENVAIAILVNIKTILNDRSQLNLKGVVINPAYPRVSFWYGMYKE